MQLLRSVRLERLCTVFLKPTLHGVTEKKTVQYLFIEILYMIYVFMKLIGTYIKLKKEHVRLRNLTYLQKVTFLPLRIH